MNCPRYIHQMAPVAPSKYVPNAKGESPTPQWKRIDAVQDVLSKKDHGVADRFGGTITPEEYQSLLLRGEG